MSGDTSGSIVMPPLDDAEEELLSGPEVEPSEAQEIRLHAEEPWDDVSELEAAD